MSFFEELRRRNVFRVGVAYAIAAWVLLQVFDVIGEILELPPWGGKLILVALAIGFILALVLAWAFEVTPEGVKLEKDVDRSQSVTHETGRKLNRATLVLMAIAIAYLLFDKFYLTDLVQEPRPGVVQSETAQPVSAGPISVEPAADSRPSIAVLPFENRSNRVEDEFFVEGVHDDLLTSLARIGSLKVISRTSMSKYRDTEKTIPEIAGELGVGTIMEGAVQRSGNTIRVNVQLIDAQSDEHLWAQIFDRELTADNLFAIQSEISSEIAKALKTTLSPEEQERLNERPTENLAAYNAYLRGRQLMARRTSTDIDQAAEEFQRAVELDPEFALAWVGVAETANLQSGYSDLPWIESLERQQMATKRALAINDQLGEAYLGQANVLEYYERYEEAEAANLKAIELSPGYATAYQWYGNLLARSPSRLDEAVEMTEKALELDPLSSIIRLNLAGKFISLGLYDEADQNLDRLMELDPGFVSAYLVRASLAANRGQMYERVKSLQHAIEMDPGRLSIYIELLWAYMDLGYVEPLDDIRSNLVEINEEHSLIGVVDMITSMYRKNYDGALESARWTHDRMGRPPFIQRVIGYINVFNGDYSAARAAFEASDPGWFDPGQWSATLEQAPSDACTAGALLIRTGDEELGRQLLQASIDYLQNTLPGYIHHADRYDVETCLLELGQTEAALAAIETRMDHGHISQFWMMRRWPLYEPLWGDPKFESLMARYDLEMAAQRARLIQEQTATL